MDLGQELKRSLREGQVLPHFQPVVDFQSGRVVGYEVLARWHHPQYGWVSPVDFIPVAEELHLMSSLTAALLRQATARWSDLPTTNLAVNVSPTQLTRECLAELVEAVTSETTFPPDQLTLEVTESALLGNLDEAHLVLSELKQLGCKLALDDFGTGYSSLTYLNSLPFDTLKIDQSFVRNMVSRREARKIVGAVIGLGKSLGLKTVAEGVEDRSQAEMLLLLGCDCGQGWHFGKPVPQDDLHRPPVQVARSEPTADPIVCLEAMPAQTHAQLKAIYNSAPVGLGFFDCSFRFVNLNHRLAAIHGLAIDEMVGRRFQELDPVRFALVEPYFLRARSGDTIDNVEVGQPESVLGDSITHLASFQPALDEVGEVVGVLVSVLDITDRKRAEALLIERHTYVQRVLDALPIGVVIAEAPSGKIVSRNPCSLKLLSQDPLEFSEIADYATRVAYYRNGTRLKAEDFPLAKAIRRGQESGPDRVLYKMGAKGKWLDISGAPILNSRDEIVGAVAALQEVRFSSPPGRVRTWLLRVGELLRWCKIRLLETA